MSTCGIYASLLAMLVDGKKISNEIKEKLKRRVSKLLQIPMLVAIQIGEDPATESFVRIKKQFAEDIGVVFELSKFDKSITTLDLKERIREIAKDPLATGIIVQLPLPEHIDKSEVLDSIPKDKDPDLLSRFGMDESRLNPVVLAIKEILEKEKVELADKKILIIGEGSLVGTPVARWLLASGFYPEVMTKDSFNKEKIKEADVIISGAGSVGIITPEDVKEGVVVIDAGTSEQAGELKGDADPRVSEKASIFTPVPGGVGPIAVAKLFENLVNLAETKKE